MLVRDASISIEDYDGDKSRETVCEMKFDYIDLNEMMGIVNKLYKSNYTYAITDVSFKFDQPLDKT